MAIAKESNIASAEAPADFSAAAVDFLSGASHA